MKNVPSIQANAAVKAMRAYDEALRALGEMRDICGNSRELSIALTNAETGRLWLTEAALRATDAKGQL